MVTVMVVAKVMAMVMVMVMLKITYNNYEHKSGHLLVKVSLATAIGGLYC